jgi:bacteriochlorophyllide a dehydrogenase
MQAKAVVFTAPNTVEYQTVDCPDPGPDNVVLRLTHSWISNGTEGSFLRGERVAGDTPYQEGEAWPFPIVVGYQRIGVVEWIGDNITDLEVGETVFSTYGLIDGLFQDRGGQCSPSVCRRENIWKLPPDTDPLAFSGMVLTQVGYNCGQRPPVDIGSAAVVVGDGMVGQWAAQTLAWRGAHVALVGRHQDRLDKFAAGHGRHRIDANQSDWRQEVGQLFPNGVQVAVDTVGSITLLEDFQPLMARYGHLVSAGFYGTQDTLALQPPRHGELSIDLVAGWSPQRMDRVLELIAAGHLQTLPLITHRFPVEQAADAWRLIESKSEPVLGVILEW